MNPTIPQGVRLGTLATLILFILWPKYLKLAGMPASPFTIFVSLVGLYLTFISLKQLSRAVLHGRFNFTVVFFVAIIIWELVAVVFGSEYSDSAAWFRQILQIKMMFVIGFFYAQTVTINTASKVILFGVALNALIGASEYLSGTLFLQFLANSFSAILDFDLEHIVTTRNFGGVFRVQATYDHPIIFGAICGIAAPLAALEFFNARTSILRLIYLLVTIILLLGIYFSGSRSGVLGLAVAVSGTAFLSAVASLRQAKPIPLIFIGILGASFFVLLIGSFNSLSEGVSEGQKISSSSREVMWDRAQYYLDSGRLFGWGYGASLPLVGLPQSSTELTVDDSLLSMWVENGTVYIILFSLMILTSLMSAVQLAAQSNADTKRHYLWFGALLISCAAVQKFNSIPYLFGFLFFASGYLSYRSKSAERNHDNTNI